MCRGSDYLEQCVIRKYKCLWTKMHMEWIVIIGSANDLVVEVIWAKHTVDVQWVSNRYFFYVLHDVESFLDSQCLKCKNSVCSLFQTRERHTHQKKRCDAKKFDLLINYWRITYRTIFAEYSLQGVVYELETPSMGTCESLFLYSENCRSRDRQDRFWCSHGCFGRVLKYFRTAQMFYLLLQAFRFYFCFQHFWSN